MKRNANKFWWCGVLLCLLAMQVPLVVGQTLSVEDMTSSAAMIVAGRVAGLNSQWNADRTQIFTTIRVNVSEVLKGNFTERELVLRVVGGAIPEENISMDIVEAPTFAINDDVTLLLKKNYASGFPFVGDVQGAFIVQNDGNAANAAGLSLPRGELRSRIVGTVQNQMQSGLAPNYVRAIHAKAAGR